MSNIILDCLLPNSIIVPLYIPEDNILSELKESLWLESKKYPLFDLLSPFSEYVFVGVTVDSQQEEFWDETRKISTLRLFSPVLKLVDRVGTQEEKNLNTIISAVIGKPISELERTKNEEIISFRKESHKNISDAISSRHQRGMASLAIYQHPPDLEPTHHLPQSVSANMDNGLLSIDIWATTTKSFSLSLPWDIYPEGIISEALKLFPLDSKESTEPKKQANPGGIKGVASYALKICGTNEYLLANRPITQYKTIRAWVSQSKRPQLFLVKRGDLYASLTRFICTQSSPPYKTSVTKSETNNSSKCNSRQSDCDNGRSTLNECHKPVVSLWHQSMAGRFKVHILKARNVGTKITGKGFVRASLFHGSYALCPAVETREIDIMAGEDTPKGHVWGEWLNFELPIQEAPRAAKLYLKLILKGSIGERKKRKVSEDETVLGIGSHNLFDFKSRLCHGNPNITLYQPAQNLVFKKNTYPLSLEIEFEERYNERITFPDEEQLHDYARYVIKLEGNPSKTECTEAILERIHSICLRDPSGVLNDDEKHFLWEHRRHCMQNPDSLPRLLDSVQWDSRDHVSQVYLLLEDWPLVSPEIALEMLQYSYADTKVRDHAVTSLSRTLPDERLAQYLLQLVHTIRQEEYLDSPLLTFLLHKSLTNKNLGHNFFWYIRSEMDLWPCPLRPLVILEAFCRGLGPDLTILDKHVKMVNKMSCLADIVKEKRCDTNKDRNKLLQKLLLENEFSAYLQHLPSPLRPSLTLGRLRLSECKVLESARRPICLVWDNSEPMGQHFSLSHSVIFKSGDDLRQDMLTLQVIGLMAHVWNSEGLDMRMTPYSCQATGNRSGLIEVVRNAKTVYSIQKRAKLGAIQVDSSQLYKWIRDKNHGRLSQAVETFTRSCAGYCVATFILGIGDRHPDNIMISEDGQIFHIDFGHFLGNFKKKFGVKRERVPFVLPQDFLRVISAGDDNPKESDAFTRFQELCGKAYLALRKHSRLILSLFTLLLSTGLPELQTMEDIDFLKKTLAVGSDDKAALLFFQQQFCEAYGGAWTTKLDWFFHSVRHR